MKTLIVIVLLTSAAFAQSMKWTWSQGTGGPATGFIVQRSTVSGGPYTTICGGTGQPACPLLGTMTYADTSAAVVPGATLYYVVEAIGPGGVSGPTNELKAVIPFLPPVSPSGLQPN